MILTIKEYLKFRGLKNKRFEMLGKKDQEFVINQLWIRMKYLFYKKIDDELEYILDKNFPKFKE